MLGVTINAASIYYESNHTTVFRVGCTLPSGKILPLAGSYLLVDIIGSNLPMRPWKQEIYDVYIL